MKRTLFTFALLLATTVSASAEDGGELFNGKDLENFNGLKTEYWSVKDGAIVGNSGKDGIKFNTFLCSDKEYGDFEMSFQVRLKGGTGNSGIQVRSEVIDMEKWVVKGPQCDIGAVYWGSLYGEKFGGMMQAAPKTIVNEVLKKDEFNDYHIKCVGKHVTIKLNGKATVDADFEKMPAKGIIAFQLHQGPAMEVTFKNIKFTSLEK